MGRRRTSDRLWRNIKWFTRVHPEHQLEGDDLALGRVDSRHSINERYLFSLPWNSRIYVFPVSHGLRALRAPAGGGERAPHHGPCSLEATV